MIPRFWCFLVLTTASSAFTGDAVGYARLDTWLRSGYQLSDKPAQFLGSATVTVGMNPTDYFAFQLSAFGRVPVDFTQAVPFVDLSDSYLQFRASNFTFTIGDLVIPWSGTRGAAINNRVNPLDYRPGWDFTPSLTGRVAQWGATVRTSAWETSLEALIFVHHTPNSSTLVATEQGGVQIGRYQGALFRNASEKVAVVTSPVAPYPTLGLRAHRHLTDSVDLGVNTLLSQSTKPSVGLDASWQLGVVVLRGELLWENAKSTWLRSASDIRNVDLNSIAGVIGAEFEYGDWFSGSLEILDVCWLNVPANERVLGVEIASNTATHTVHRLALATSMEGSVSNRLFDWRVIGEFGLLQPDILATFDVHHTWQELGLSAGVFSNIYAGMPGSTGWMRAEATTIGIFARHEL